jgi:hypothetical protein
MSDRVLTVVGCENDSLLLSKAELNLTVESIYLCYLKTKLHLFSEPKMHRPTLKTIVADLLAVRSRLLTLMSVSLQTSDNYWSPN